MTTYDNRERRRLRPSKTVSCRFPLLSEDVFVLHDLSEVGLSLDGPPIAEPGAECVLEVAVRPERPDRPLRLLVRCERTTPLESGFGRRTAVELVDFLDPDGLRVYEEFVRLQCYDPSRI